MKKLFAAALALCSPLAFANIQVCQGDAVSCLPANWDPTDLEAVHFDQASSGVNYATGTPQGSGNGIYNIEFTSTELFSTGAGFAILTADDGGINDLSFNINSLVLPSDFGIEVAEFSLNRRDNQNAQVSFDWVESDGTLGFDPALYALGPGETTFTIWADPETLEQVNISSLQGFEVASFKHLRIDPDFIDPQPVSAPGGLALLGLGLVGLMRLRATR